MTFSTQDWGRTAAEADQRQAEREAEDGDLVAPSLADLREGRVSPEAFLASRNSYQTRPFRTRSVTVEAAA